MYVCICMYTVNIVDACIHTYIYVSPLNSGEPERHRLCDEIPDHPAVVSLQLHELFDLLRAVEEHVELPVQVHCMYTGFF